MIALSNVGFIGMGKMGTPMASYLCKSGYALTVYDLNPEASEKFVAHNGGHVAANLADVGRAADVVITMLPNDKAVREVICGVNGVAATLAKGGIVIDMGTSDPLGTRSLAEALAPRGINVVDAPVMGGVVFARDATLDIMVAGDPAAVERVTPLLKAMGRSLINCGAVGNAHALKALGNYINSCALINVVEAMSIGAKFGLDAKFMAEALLPMVNGRQHPLEKKVIPQILTREFSTGMEIGFITKDLKIALDTAKSLDAYAPLAECTHALWAEAIQLLGAHPDQTEVAKLWEHNTGVLLKTRDVT